MGKVSHEQVLSRSLEQLALHDWACSVLRSKGVRTLRDILKLDSADISRVCEGDRSVERQVRNVHVRFAKYVDIRK